MGDEKVHEHDIVKRDRTEGFDLTDPDVPEGTREKAESSESDLCEKYLTLPFIEVENGIARFKTPRALCSAFFE